MMVGEFLMKLTRKDLPESEILDLFQHNFDFTRAAQPVCRAGRFYLQRQWSGCLCRYYRKRIYV